MVSIFILPYRLLNKVSHGDNQQKQLKLMMTFPAPKTSSIPHSCNDRK